MPQPSSPVEHRIVFTPSGLSGMVAHGTTVLDAARRLGADLDTVCGGRGICGRCQIVPSVGSFPKWAITVAPDALGPPASIETDYHGNRPLLAGRRLGCAARINGDVVVDVPPTSQVHRQVVRKDLDLPPITVDPSFTLLYVDGVKPPEFGSTATRSSGESAAELVASAVAEQHGRPEPAFAVDVLSKLHGAIKGNEATVAVDESNVVVAIWPGYVDTAFGVAVDIGSTTIAGHICDLTSGEVLASAGRMNPQIRFGEDLMSRVSFVMMNPGGDRELTEAVRLALDELIGELVNRTRQTRDRVLEVVLVGNPIMHHIVLGIDPTPLGQAPFTLATNRSVVAPASDLDLDLPNGRVYVGPCIAGHVGADTAGAILSEGPHRSEHMQLLVDVGTNAEIVLGDRHHQFAASSPTGPAFEGAQISAGQRATAGAIEGVRIDPETLEPRLKVIGVDVWSDDPAFAAKVAKSGVSGICGSGIIDVIAEMYLSGVIDRDGVVQGDLAARTPRVVADGRTFSYVLWGDADEPEHRIAITQNDVRAIQLAKAALRAGIDLLIEHAGQPPVTDIRLAGAFGAHIDPLHALVLGLVPDCPLDGVRSVGNAAGTGAVQA
ncbi:MAG TPA: ASKHA domain-containing protein, partial [Ilumatobacteraceae bacterium]|nr:ASKHA domain-containing protein [Ilumatobacteraceae bacterium]